MVGSIGIRAHVLVFLTVLLLWLLLTASLDPAEIGAGVLVGLVVSAVSGRHLVIFDGLRLRPFAVVALVDYLLYFFYALVRANVDVARKVLAPSLPITPSVVEVSTDLESPLGRMLLANSITLTPGTLTVDLDGGRLLVHWINVPEGCDIDTATREIAAGFEKRISGFLR